ncbi:unnamed protein product [Dicrocoelium dendriticum]|nr:unnamed protein product [Dicrocoelium dendriticum]
MVTFPNILSESRDFSVPFDGLAFHALTASKRDNIKCNPHACCYNLSHIVQGKPLSRHASHHSNRNYGHFLLAEAVTLAEYEPRSKQLCLHM